MTEPTTAAGRALLAYYYPDAPQPKGSTQSPTVADRVHEAGRRDTLRDILAIEAEARQQDGLALRSALERLVSTAYHYGEPIEHMSCRASYQSAGKCSCGISPAIEQARLALEAIPPSAPPALDVERLVAAAMLDQPVGGGWNDQIVMSKADLHGLLNRHTEAQIRAALAEWEPVA